MASTYSSLKIQLMATGENSGTWGNVTNDNLGVAIEEAIAESADVAFSGSNVTISLTDTNASQEARNLRLNLTGTGLGATTALTVPDIEKPYIINNGLSDDVEVKNSTGSNVTVPAGKTMWVYSTGSNVVDVTTHATSLTLGTPLAITSGGTGTNSTTFVNLTSNVTDVLPAANGGTGLNALGTNVATFLGTPSSANLADAVTDETGSGALVFGTAPSISRSLLNTTKEKLTISATAATGTINFDAITQSVLYYTTDASGNWTLNVRGDSGTTLDSIMSTGESITVAFLATQGATAYYQSAFEVDGSSVTPKWQGGEAPTEGNASGIDAYVINIIKTGSATFTALASITQFA